MGTPALLQEGMSWREVRLRAMHAAPIKLPPRPSGMAALQPPRRSSDSIGAEG
jgi:phosphatidylinositol alpha-mannosyltransferase